MEEQILITEEMLLNAGFEYQEEASEMCKKAHLELYGVKEYKMFSKWTNDKSPIKLDIDNGWNNSAKHWHLHIDNCDCNTIGCADIDYTWQFNKLMEVFDSDFRL